VVFVQKATKPTSRHRRQLPKMQYLTQPTPGARTLVLQRDPAASPMFFTAIHTPVTSVESVLDDLSDADIKKLLFGVSVAGHPLSDLFLYRVGGFQRKGDGSITSLWLQVAPGFASTIWSLPEGPVPDQASARLTALKQKIADSAILVNGSKVHLRVTTAVEPAGAIVISALPGVVIPEIFPEATANVHLIFNDGAPAGNLFTKVTKLTSAAPPTLDLAAATLQRVMNYAAQNAAVGCFPASDFPDSSSTNTYLAYSALSKTRLSSSPQSQGSGQSRGGAEGGPGLREVLVNFSRLRTQEVSALLPLLGLECVCDLVKTCEAPPPAATGPESFSEPPSAKRPRTAQPPAPHPTLQPVFAGLKGAPFQAAPAQAPAPLPFSRGRVSFNAVEMPASQPTGNPAPTVLKPQAPHPLQATTNPTPQLPQTPQTSQTQQTLLTPQSVGGFGAGQSGQSVPSEAQMREAARQERLRRFSGALPSIAEEPSALPVAEPQVPAVVTPLYFAPLAPPQPDLLPPAPALTPSLTSLATPATPATPGAAGLSADSLAGEVFILSQYADPATGAPVLLRVINPDVGSDAFLRLLESGENAHEVQVEPGVGYLLPYSLMFNAFEGAEHTFVFSPNPSDVSRELITGLIGRGEIRRAPIADFGSAPAPVPPTSAQMRESGQAEALEERPPGNAPVLTGTQATAAASSKAAAEAARLTLAANGKEPGPTTPRLSAASLVGAHFILSQFHDPATQAPVFFRLTNPGITEAYMQSFERGGYVQQTVVEPGIGYLIPQDFLYPAFEHAEASYIFSPHPSDSARERIDDLIARREIRRGPLSQFRLNDASRPPAPSASEYD